jgi:hypothetical protein
VLIGSIARQALTVNKAALEKSDYEFTLEELMQFDSIEEARGELINRRVDALLLKSVDEWSNWCKRTLQLDLPSLTSDWPTVREIFARRNIIVHNAGIVNRRYLNIAQSEGIALPEGIKEGDFLATNSDYALSAIQLLLALGLRLTFAAWKKLYPKNAAEAADWLVDRQETACYYGMWVTALELTQAFRNVRAKRAATCRAEVYGWLARTHLYGRASVTDEVTDWDISGLDVTFAIYRQCLLGNNEAAINLIRQHLGEDGLTKYEIYTDPIFSEVKEKVLAQYMPQSGHALTQPEPETETEPPEGSSK